MTKRRVVAAGIVLAVIGLATGCSSSAKPDGAPATASTTTNTVGTSTTVDSAGPKQQPYAVGDLVPLTNGWHAEVVKVQRPYSPAALPPAPAGQEYVAVDVVLQNDGPGTAKIAARKIYALVDQTGTRYPPAQSSGIDGQYPPATKRAGTIVFSAPANAPLMLRFDGVLIGTTRATFRTS